MIPSRYDVTEVVAARRRTRPPTWLFVAGVVVGWLLDAALVALAVALGVGVAAAVVVAVLGYLVLPVPIVTAAREVWLRAHRERGHELDRQLGDHIPAFRAWLDARLGGPVDLPPDLAMLWLLRPEPRSAHELLALAPEAGWRIGGAAIAARHESIEGHVVVRLAVLPSATLLGDGPEPPSPR